MFHLILETWERFFELLLRSTGGRGQLTVREDEEVEQMARAMAWRVRRVFDELTRPGVADELERDFLAILPAANTVLGWFDLVNRIVAQAEARYGPGSGEHKARVVRGVILRLFRQANLHIPELPDLFEPVVYDFVIRVSIDAMVDLNNVNELWPRVSLLATPKKPSFGWGARLRGRVGRWLEHLAWNIILLDVPLDADFEAEVNKAANAANVEQVRNSFAAFLRLAAGLAADRGVVHALISVISTAVSEAEAGKDWDGPTKRAFATAMVMAMMEDFGWIPEDAWYRGALEGAVGLGIDLVVKRLNDGRPSWRAAPPRRIGVRT